MKPAPNAARKYGRPTPHETIPGHPAVSAVGGGGQCRCGVGDTPAVAAGVTARKWEIEDIVKLLEDLERKQQYS